MIDYLIANKSIIELLILSSIGVTSFCFYSFGFWQLKNKFISQYFQNLINSNQKKLKSVYDLKSYMLLTSNSFLFLFLPFSLLINLFSVSKTTKTFYLGVLSAYFYYIDNGYLLIILLFIINKFKCKQNNIIKISD